MTKKVSKRSWSIEKFTTAVKNGCEKQGTKFLASRIGQAYEDGWTVAYTVAQFAQYATHTASKREKKAA